MRAAIGVFGAEKDVVSVVSHRYFFFENNVVSAIGDFCREKNRRKNIDFLPRKFLAENEKISQFDESSVFFTFPPNKNSSQQKKKIFSPHETQDHFFEKVRNFSENVKF